MHSLACTNDCSCSMFGCSCPVLERINVFKYLGLLIYDHLKWKSPIWTITSKLELSCSATYHEQHNYPTRVFGLIYDKLGKPVLEYSITTHGQRANYLNTKLKSTHKNTERNSFSMW